MNCIEKRIGELEETIARRERIMLINRLKYWAKVAALAVVILGCAGGSTYLLVCLALG